MGGNPRPPHFQSIPDPVIWARFGIKTLADIASADGLYKFDALKGKYGLLKSYVLQVNTAPTRLPVSIPWSCRAGVQRY